MSRLWKNSEFLMKLLTLTMSVSVRCLRGFASDLIIFWASRGSFLNPLIVSGFSHWKTNDWSFLASFGDSYNLMAIFRISSIWDLWSEFSAWSSSACISILRCSPGRSASDTDCSLLIILFLVKADSWEPSLPIFTGLGWYGLLSFSSSIDLNDYNRVIFEIKRRYVTLLLTYLGTSLPSDSF